MIKPEIILNLWYVHDDMGFIYSLRARAYVGTGTDEEKTALLQSFANVDYLVARSFPIPERFHIEVKEGRKRKRVPVAPQECLNGLDSPIALFEDAIKVLEADLPAQTGLSIGQAPLFSTTALLADDAGRVYSGRRKLTLRRHKESVEVSEPTWALIIAFVAKHGWTPSESADSFLSGECEMSQEDAVALAEAGRAVLCQVLKDPLALQLRFDLEKFAQIADFALAGGFRVTR